MTDILKKKIFCRFIFVLSVFAWMVMIYVISGFQAETSNEQSGVVVELVKKIFNISSEQPELLDNLTTIVRKCAHAFEYFVLGILLLNVIRQFWPTIRKKSWSKYWYLAVIGASIYAVTDEVHQAFVPGRSCELRDIMIDKVAAGVGVGMVMLLRRWRHRKQLVALYPWTKFPSFKKRFKHGVLLVLSSSRWLYGVAYSLDKIFGRRKVIS